MIWRPSSWNSAPSGRESAPIRVDRQKAFDDKNTLGFPLLSDPDRKVAALFGVKRFGPLPSKRATFVIDTDRTVIGAFSSELDMDGHADRALKILRER